MTDEQLQRIVSVAREHAIDAAVRGVTGAPTPGDVVVEVSHFRERAPDPNALGTLCWWATMAAWDDEYPDLQRLTWDIVPVSGRLTDDGNTVWTWEIADFMVVPSLDLVLQEAACFIAESDDNLPLGPPLDW